jgi:hypothetical protein
MTINRALGNRLRRLARSFPAVAVTGPRQSGKTTLVRELFADKPYLSLEDPDFVCWRWKIRADFWPATARVP